MADAVPGFEPGLHILMATRNATVKKTDLMAFSRPRTGGIIALGLAEGERVRVVTEVGRAELELEQDPSVRPGTVIIPHGFGLDHQAETAGAVQAHAADVAIAGTGEQ